MYLRICLSENPNLARSHGQKALMVADDTSTGLPRMSAKELMSRRGCDISTCGSFWKIAITARTGTPVRNMFKEIKLLEPMPKSAAPPASSWGTFTSGPPWMIFTFSPRLA